jgi:structural maintenance of chromosome 4
MIFVHVRNPYSSFCQDKTLPFQRQIEAKQKDLAPWTAKVNAKQSEVDLGESERAMLAEKATGAQAAVDEAVSTLEKLRADRAFKENELADLNRERKNLDKQVKEGGAKLAVRLCSIDAMVKTLELHSL